MSDVYLARQPIYNRELKLMGYELFYRHADVESAEFIDGDVATSQLLLGILNEVDLSTVVGNQPAFINVARNFIIDGNLAALAGRQIVPEIVGDIAVDEPLLAVLRELRAQGMRFVLDDYVDREANQFLLQTADYAKIDMLTTSEEEVRRLAPLLKQQGVAVMAERLETQEQMELCQSLEFDYFQGYYFSQPKLLKFRGLPTNKLTLIQLIGKLNDAKTSTKEIEALIIQDASLSYRLLRYINSAYYNLPKKIDSIQRAVLLLGINKIRSWATIISLATANESCSDLMNTALVRAKMCQALAEAKGLTAPETSFTVGLLSILDVLTQSPLDKVIASLPLAEEISGALLHHEGLLGRILACTLAYERCDWDELDTLDLSPDQISDIHMDALADAYRAAYELL